MSRKSIYESFAAAAGGVLAVGSAGLGILPAMLTGAACGACYAVIHRMSHKPSL